MLAKLSLLQKNNNRSYRKNIESRQSSVVGEKNRQKNNWDFSGGGAGDSHKKKASLLRNVCNEKPAVQSGGSVSALFADSVIAIKRPIRSYQARKLLWS